MRLMILLALAGLLCPAGWCVTLLPDGVTTLERVETSAGTKLLWRRAQATPHDLMMPFYPNALQLESVVYRVRDRKRRDQLRYALARFSTTQPAEQVALFYREALGEAARIATGASQGELLISAGTVDDFQLVTVTPTESGAAIKLERTQSFTIPPRVYTPAEERVVDVVERITAYYREAPRLSMTIRQQAEFPDDPSRGTPAPLQWSFALTRPNEVRVTARVEDQEVLTIATEHDELVVTRARGTDRRAVPADGLSGEQLPELFGDPRTDPVGDPLIRMVFGEQLIIEDTDYLMLQTPSGQPAEIVLTYPEDHVKLWLYFDPATRMVERSIVEIEHDGHRQRIVRNYTIADPAVTEPVPAP